MITVIEDCKFMLLRFDYSVRSLPVEAQSSSQLMGCTLLCLSKCSDSETYFCNTDIVVPMDDLGTSTALLMPSAEKRLAISARRHFLSLLFESSKLYRTRQLVWWLETDGKEKVRGIGAW
jgi:hypothetical protein